MSDDHAIDVQKHVRTYMVVFGTLFVLTIATVLVSWLHLPLLAAVVVALVIATIKASLVACYFMHLISEKRLIYGVLILTVAFFVALLFLPFLTSSLDQVGS